MGLLPEVVEIHVAHRLPLGTAGPHVLGVAAAVALDEGVRLLHDGPGGAVVGLHQQHLPLRVDLPELHQRLGPGRPEAVDALILVPHHEQVAAPGSQQAEDGVLDFGGILGLVHTEVGVFALEVGQDVGVPAENPQGKDHLVVVVHAAVALQILPVTEIDGGEIHPVHLNGPHLLIPQHAVLAAGDAGAHLLHLLLPRPLGPVGLHQPAHQGVQLPLIGPQSERLRPLGPGVVGDDGLADAVDGAEGQRAGVRLPKEGGKAPLHVPGGGYSVGDGEDAPRLHPQAVDEIAQPGHQGGGLAAARHRQQQGGPLGPEDGRLLLGIGGEGVSGFEFGVGHGVSSLSVRTVQSTPAPAESQAAVAAWSGACYTG